VPSYIALLAITLSVGYVLTIDTNPKILTTSDNGQTLLRNTETYRAAAQRIIESSLMNRTKFTINTSGISRSLQAEFPEITEVSIALPLLGRRPVIHVNSIRPVLVLGSNNKGFLVDANGRAVAEAAQVPSARKDNLPVVTDESNLSVTIGKNTLTREEVSFIVSVAAYLDAQQLHVTSLTLPPVASELHVRLQEVPYFVKFNMQAEARQSVGTYLATKQKLEQDHITPGEYVDVRVEEKVFFK